MGYKYMKKILILALLLSSLFANDKFSNLANAANSVVKNDKWIKGTSNNQLSRTLF